jgi:hypothetical protein
MRRIKLNKWKAKDREGNDQDEDLLMALNVLLGNKKPEDIPRGLDKFRLFHRLAKAFDKADESRELVLEEADYSFLKEMVEKDVPSVWGMNENLSEALEDFLNAKQEEL